MKLRQWLPWMVTAVFAVWVAGSLRLPADKDLAFQQFGRLPVIYHGRTQPMDSLARNSLLQLREKQTANLEPWKAWNQHPKIIPATEWMMGVMMKSEEADAWPVFRIDNPDVKGLLGLPGEPDAVRQQDGKHYSWTQIQPKLGDLAREAGRAAKVEDARRGPYDQALLKLWNAQQLYTSLRNALGPAGTGDLATSVVPYLQKFESGRAAYVADMNGRATDRAALAWFSEQFETPLVVAASAEGSADRMIRTADALIQTGGEMARMPFSLLAYNDISHAYRANDVAGFNAAVADYQSHLGGHDYKKELSKARAEQFFNHIEPFYKAMVLFVCAFLLVLGYWMRPGAWDWLRTSAVGLVCLALVIHTGGLLYRMILEGRPPVTNLYSSAIFIGWGATVLGLVLERLWRNSIGLLVSCIIGFTTLIIAHHLRLGEDTMIMMRAVLDTNFWLATHVVVVTLGYASTFVAGILATIYILMGVFTRNLTTPMSRTSAQVTGAAVSLMVKTGGSSARTAANVAAAAEKGELGKSITRMIYGIICFATLFSFVGTVLGGIWADQSWGRFWGWDPKENGALIIVLWNALILHARWGGLARDRGLANLAIVGNIVTAWSWFGVNMLGIGLHSYGFTSAAFLWLVAFGSSQLLLIGLGLLPRQYWRSFQANPAGPTGRAIPAAG